MAVLGLISDDAQLYKRFVESDQFESVAQVDFEKINESGSDVVLVSDHIIKPQQLMNKMLDLATVKVFYMVSKENFTSLSEAFYSSRDIQMIPPALTVEQIYLKVVRATGGGRAQTSNIFTFFGADTKVGTSMVVSSLAQAIAQRNEMLVVLPLDGSYGNAYINFDSKYGLEDIRTKLMTRILSDQELREMCIPVQKGYAVLPGIRNILNMNTYHPDQIEFLLKKLSGIFDVVLIDAGSRIDIGMTLAGLNVTQNRFLVTTQQEGTYQQFSRVKKQVLDRLQITEFLLVVNKYIETPELPRSGTMAERYGAIQAAVLPYMEFGWQCEKEKSTLLDFRSKVYQEGIESIEQIVYSHLGMLPRQETHTKRTGIFRRLFKKTS